MRVLMLLLICPLVFAGQITHFTAADSGFTSELVLRNGSRNAEPLRLKLYSGERNQTVDLELAPGESRILDGQALVLWPTHLSFECSDLVSVSARYRVKAGGNAVTVASNQEPARVYHYGYLDPSDFWTGLALVSLEAGTRVQFRQINASGVVIFERELASGLGAFKRSLLDISSLPLVADTHSYFEIEASRPVVATMLFGTRGGAPVMSQAMPEKRFDDRIVAGYTGGIAGLAKEITIRRGTLTVGGQTYAIQNYEAIRARLLELGAIGHRVEVQRNPCCDQFDFHLEFVDGANRNRFSISSFDLDGRNSDAELGYGMIEAIFEIARQQTGQDLWLPK